jgi:GNAT superfamily N-acetyltransferase
MKQAKAPWQVVPLDSKGHDRSAFSCGAAELDRYIREHASQDVNRDIARVFVALRSGTLSVCGYYSLSAASFQRDNLPADQAKRLPRYPVPAALLGRLAVDDGAKGKGLGAFLLMDVLNRTLLATQTLAVHAMIVDARDDTAAAFYRKYGFIPFTGGEQRRLFLPMSTIRKSVKS